MGRGECKLGVWGGLYKMGIKVEFEGFIGMGGNFGLRRRWDDIYYI